MSNWYADIDLARPLTDHDIFHNLVGWWMPHISCYTGGKLYDFGLNKHHATVDNSSAWCATKFGHAIDFDGYGPTVTATSVGIAGTTKITYVAYVYRPNPVVQAYARIMVDKSYGTELKFNGGKIEAQIANTGLMATGDIVYGWQQCAMAFNSGETDGFIIYRNGQKCVSSTLSATVGTENNLILGSYGDKWLDGPATMFAAFTRALNESEMTFLYEQSLKGYPDLIRRKRTRSTFFMSPSLDAIFSANQLSAATTIPGDTVQSNKTLELTL